MEPLPPPILWPIPLRVTGFHGASIRQIANIFDSSMFLLIPIRIISKWPWCNCPPCRAYRQWHLTVKVRKSVPINVQLSQHMQNCGSFQDLSLSNLLFHFNRTFNYKWFIPYSLVLVSILELLHTSTTKGDPDKPGDFGHGDNTKLRLWLWPGRYWISKETTKWLFTGIL